MANNRFNAAYFIARESCPVCGSREQTVLYSCPMTEDPVRGFIESHYSKQGKAEFSCLEGTDYTLCDCSGCGLIYQKYAPNDAMLDVIYNQMADPSFLFELAKSRMTVENFEGVAGELTVLMRLTGKRPADVKFLDYGLGFGRWARVAVAMGAKVFATEISHEKIAYARKIGVEIIDDEALQELRFDVIHTEQVFEHLTDPAQQFRRLASALTAGGIMKMAVPPQGHIRSLMNSEGMIGWSPQAQLWEPEIVSNKASRYDDYVSVLPLEHLNAYSPRSVEFLARGAELAIISRVRNKAVPVYVNGSGLLLRSISNLAKEMLRPVFRKDCGYYLFRSEMNGSRQ